VYNYKDHLGNIRISYTFDTATSSLRILEENNYYPFGLKHQENLQARTIRFKQVESTSSFSKGVGFFEAIEGIHTAILLNQTVANSGYQYKYNGKEWQDELGLNLYDYGWRNYDPAIGRFQKLDRFSEKYHKLSPYGYAGNNPVLINDIQGDSLWISHGNEKLLYQNGNLSTRGKDGTFSQYKGEYAKLDKNGNVKGYNGILGQTVDALNTLQTKSDFANNMINDLQNSNNNFNIMPSDTAISGFRCDLRSPDGRVGALNNNGYAYQVLEQGFNMVNYAPFDKIGEGGNIVWNPKDGFITLGHEIGHVVDSNYGMLDSRRVKFNGGIEEIREIRAVYYENRIRQDMNMSLRKSYSDDGPKLINSLKNPMYIQLPSILILNGQ
jgi:RHS repeat-associated protein